MENNYTAKGFMRMLKIEGYHGSPEEVIIEKAGPGYVLKDMLFKNEFAIITGDAFNEGCVLVKDFFHGIVRIRIDEPEKRLEAFKYRATHVKSVSKQKERNEMLEGAKMAYQLIKQ